MNRYRTTIMVDLVAKDARNAAGMLNLIPTHLGSARMAFSFGALELVEENVEDPDSSQARAKRNAEIRSRRAVDVAAERGFPIGREALTAAFCYVCGKPIEGERVAAEGDFPMWRHPTCVDEPMPGEAPVLDLMQALKDSVESSDRCPACGGRGWRDEFLGRVPCHLCNGSGKREASGGRLPDPGPDALCARCGQPRKAHGGAAQLGACPDQHPPGLYAKRFQLQEVDKVRDA